MQTVAKGKILNFRFTWNISYYWLFVQLKQTINIHELCFRHRWMHHACQHVSVCWPLCQHTWWLWVRVPSWLHVVTQWVSSVSRYSVLFVHKRSLLTVALNYCKGLWQFWVIKCIYSQDWHSCFGCRLQTLPSQSQSKGSVEGELDLALQQVTGVRMQWLANRMHNKERGRGVLQNPWLQDPLPLCMCTLVFQRQRHVTL